MASWLIVCAVLSVYDGDTVICDGERLRLLGEGIPHVVGIDTPELTGRRCPRELDLARAAKARLKELIDGKKIRIVAEGRDDGKRPLVNLYLPDGREAGKVLMDEGHARTWRPNWSNDWCTGGPERHKR